MTQTMWVTLESHLSSCFHFHPPLHATAALKHSKGLSNLSLGVDILGDGVLFHVKRSWASLINSSDLVAHHPPDSSLALL